MVSNDDIAAKRARYWKRVDDSIYDHVTGDTLMPFQREGVEWLGQRPRGILADDMGLGKGSLANTPLLTPAGWSTYGEISVGDSVVGSNGQATRVTGVYPRGMLRVYRVQFSDGSSTVVDGDHLWSVNTAVRKMRGNAGITRSTRSLTEEPLVDIVGNARWFIPVVAPVEFTPQDLPIDPYALGLLLGDGGLSQHSIKFSSADPELISSLSTATGLEVRHRGRYDYSVIGEKRTSNSLIRSLKLLGLMSKRSESKFIPDIYKFGSVADRVALLQGLLDTDGYVQPNSSNVEYSSSSRRLIEDVQFLVESLGGIARIREHPTKHLMSYRFSVVLPDQIQPFRLSRKANAYHSPTKYHPARAITNIEDAGFGDVICISVSAPDKLYVTEHCIVTHNTVQALASTVGSDAFPCLFITMSTLRGTMAAQVEKWTGLKSYVMDSGNRGASILAQKTLPRPFFIVSYENVRAEADKLRAFEWKSILVDEATCIKNRGAQRTKAVKSIKAPRITLLSGTPLLNSPIDLWSLLNYLDPVKYASYWAFEKKFCIMGGWQNKQIVGYRNVPELKMHVQSKMLRRRKDEVLKDLPPKTYSDVMLNLPAWQRKLYNVAHDDLIIQIKNDKTLTVATALAKMIRLKQLAVSPQWTLGVESKQVPIKLQALDEILDARPGRRTIIWSMYATVATKLAEHIKQSRKGMKVFLLTGATPQHRRHEQEAEFQALGSDEDGVWIGTITAGGMGLTLTSADTVIFMDRDWRPKINEQAEDRAHRIGQKDNVNVINLIAQDTVEDHLEKVLLRKRAMFDDIVEKDGGFQNVRLTFDDLKDLL